MDSHDAKKPTKFFGLSRNVISMGAVSFLNDLSSDMIFPFIPIFLTSVLGATATFVGLVEGAADATASIIKIVSGRLSDRLRIRKPFVIAGYSFSAVAKPILSFAASPWHVFFVRFLDRVGKGTRDAPRDALISFSTEKKDIGRAFGFHRGADTLGAAFGPLIAVAILPFIGGNSEEGLRALFLLSFVASFFAVLILKIFVREVKSPRDGIERPKLQFKFLGVPFMIFLGAATILALGRASDAFLLLRAHDVGITLVLLPLVYFSSNLAFSIFSTPAGILSDRIGHRNTYMIGMILFSTIYFLFSLASSSLSVWLLFVFYGLYYAFTEGVGRAVVADLVREEWRATAFGVYNAFTGIALLPASLIFGFLWDRFGPAVSFRYGATLGLIAFAVFLFFRARDHWQTRY